MEDNYAEGGVVLRSVALDLFLECALEKWDSRAAAAVADSAAAAAALAAAAAALAAAAVVDVAVAVVTATAIAVEIAELSYGVPLTMVALYPATLAADDAEFAVVVAV